MNITGDSYRMRRHRDALQTLRAGLIAPQEGGHSRDHTRGVPATLDNVPRPNADWHQIAEFSTTFDGYAHFGDDWGPRPSSSSSAAIASAGATT